jgi:hypothetical protein
LCINKFSFEFRHRSNESDGGHSPSAGGNDDDDNDDYNRLSPTRNSLVETPTMIVWSGNINMSGYYRFVTSAVVLSGGDAAQSLFAELPKTIDVVGRIMPSIVWEYVKNVRQTPDKDLIILRLMQPSE